MTQADANVIAIGMASLAVLTGVALRGKLKPRSRIVIALIGIAFLAAYFIRYA